MRLKDMGQRGGDAIYLNPDEIEEIEGYNSRSMESDETVAYIRRMADSIKENGILSFPPITVRQIDGKIYVYAGHCRRRAFSLAKSEGADFKGILALIVNKNLKDDDMILDILTSNDGLPLKPLEKANAVNRLIRCGWTTAEISRKLGWSESWITTLIDLLNAPNEVKSMVRNGEVSATLAVDQVRKSKGKATEKLTTAIAKAKKAGKPRATQQHIKKRVPDRLWRNLHREAKLLGMAYAKSDLEQMKICTENLVAATFSIDQYEQS